MVPHRCVGRFGGDTSSYGWAANPLALHSAQRASGRIEEAVRANCEAQKLEAAIQRRSLINSQAENRALLPRLSFPGLTRAELRALARMGEVERAEHVATLNRLAHRICALQ